LPLHQKVKCINSVKFRNDERWQFDLVSSKHRFLHIRLSHGGAIPSVLGTNPITGLLDTIYGYLLSAMDHSETNNTASTGGSSHTPFSGVLGTGLVEITALTTLIGSNTAEQLALGNRGPTGLAWMAMSTFGSLSVLRACIAASTPGWLRDTLGVRSATTDSARGLSLDLASPWMGREDMTRRDLGDAIGVTCGRREVNKSCC
jgi:hypothetical protein